MIPVRTPPHLIATEAAFRAAARALHAQPAASFFDPNKAGSIGPSDFDLNPELAGDLNLAGPPRDAAVLVPVVKRSELTVLLTQRTDHLPSHAGQISFPGGKVEPGDPGPAATALREAEEEIGLRRNLVEPLGFLDSYRTGTGFRIVPLVGLVDPGFELKPDPREVAAVFEVPLTFLLDPANHQLHSRIWKNRERHFYAMPYNDRFIWGATAGMIRNMYERLLAQ